MFATIRRTWTLCKLSLRVLMQDKDMLLLPLLGVVGVIVVVAVFAGIAEATGSLERLDGALTEDESQASTTDQVTVLDVGIAAAALLSATYVGIFFNAALISGAMMRLRGEDPTAGSAIASVTPYAFGVLAWAIISMTVGLVLGFVKSRSGWLGRIAIALVGGVWAYMTFSSSLSWSPRASAPFRPSKTPRASSSAPGANR